ncbi:hypothetical protein ACWGDE_04990 [Streptomyces sp. NPDC054956]
MALFSHARGHTSRGSRPARAWAATATAFALAAGLVTGIALPAQAASAPAVPADLKQAPQVDVALLRAQQAAATQAKKNGKAVVVDALTTENAQTVANPDGTFTLSQDAGPVRARKNDAWVPVDTKLARRADGTFAPGATDADVAFSGGGTGPLVTMVREGKAVSLTWPTALPEPTVSGNTATYPAVLPDVDLTVSAHADGFSQVLVVKTPEAAANPALTSLKLATRTDGLTLGQSGSGDAEAKDASGRTVFRADPPLVWDSADNAAPAASAAPKAKDPKDAKAGRAPSVLLREAPASALAPAPAPSVPAPTPGTKAADPKRSSTAGPGAGAHTTRMGMTVGKGDITITPDKEVLTGKDTVYPLYIDPAWSGNPSVVAWASINSGGWKATTGNEARVGYLGNWSGCGSYCYTTARSYFEMNADGFRGANVTNATFRPYFTWAADSAQQPTEIWVDPDFPGDLNWNNKPSSGSSNYVTAVSSCIGHYTASGCDQGTVDFNVTSAAQGAANWGWRNFEVDAKDESNQYQWKKIDPTRTSWTVTYYRAPYLDGQDATTPTVTGPGGTFVNSHDVTMKATGGNTAGEQVQSGYEIWNWANGTNGSAVVGGLFSPYTATGGAYTYSGLPDGSYAWRGVTHSQEGGLWSGWSAWHPFTVDTTAPPTPNVSSPEFPAGQFGAAYFDQGTFGFTTNGRDNVAGYLFALDADLGSTVWSQQSPPPAWTPGQAIVRGRQYWTPSTNTLASVRFAPDLVGPHRLYVKAVDQAGLASAQATHAFWAGLTEPAYVPGGSLFEGYTAVNDDSSKTVLPAATASTTGSLGIQNSCCYVKWMGDRQAMLANGPNPITVNDSAKFNFAVPHSGYWNLGASLTTSYDYGRLRFVLDAGTPSAITLPGPTPTTDWDTYSANVNLMYADFGLPKNASGTPVELSQGAHTLTVTVVGKNASSAGLQFGIDALRLAPASATCKLSNLTDCRNNIAISSDANHDAADADGSTSSFSAGQLAAAGWTPGAKITVNGAPMTVPDYAVGKADNILSSGQTVTVDATGTANSPNSVVFLAFATGGDAFNATGTITYPKKADGTTTCGSGTNTTYPYALDSVPSWISTAAAPAPSITFPGRNRPGTTTDTKAPQAYAISVPVPCPGVPIASISLPVVTAKALPGNHAVHVLGVGLRQSSYENGSTSPNWTGTWAARQDSNLGTWTDQTVRIPAKVTIGNTPGGKVRIRLSNALGTTPATFPHVSVAPQAAAGGATAASAPLPLTFGGSASVTIPAGGEVLSDPVALTVPEKSTLLVSIQLAGAIPNVSAHGAPQASIWATPQGTGNHTADTASTGFTVSVPGIPYLAGVDVTPAAHSTGALVLYGDQTVNSDTTTGDNAHHLSDLIYERVAADHAADEITNPAPGGVLNAGRNSWTPANNYLAPISASSTPLSPTSAGNPVDRAVLDNSNVRTVLVSTGAADIQNNVGATDVQNRLTALVQQMRKFRTDEDPTGWTFIKVHVATVPAWPGMTAAQDTVRKTVNNYIRCGASNPADNSCPNGNNNPLNGSADLAVDFAAAVSVGNTTGGALDLAAYTYTDTNGKVLPNQSYYQALANRYASTAR